jgi:hypothetical protein
MRPASLLLGPVGLALATTVAQAQPVVQPSENAPLAAIRDEKELAQTLAKITQDPAVRVDDPKARPIAAALMVEGVRQLQAKAYEQALATFLDAYNRFPSPKILLNVASTLRDMGRTADAANTYQRYLGDPSTGPERIAEVKKLLIDLDQQLTILTIHVSPKGSELSIDGGPFIPVGSSLTTRVRAGIHMVRIRKDSASNEISVNGFEGELKDMTATLPEAPVVPTPPVPPPTEPGKKPLPTVRTPEEPPDQVFGWLDSSTQYGTSDVTSRQRQVNNGFSGPPVAAIIPDLPPEQEAVFTQPVAQDSTIRSGVIGIVRIDGKGRGIAGGLGIAFAPVDSVELELAVLRSNQWGGYAGARVRFLTGSVRPYAGGGIPAFLFEDENDAMRTKVALGLRAAGGVELKINGHLSVQADLGIEHYFNIDDNALVGGKRPERTVFVPTVGVIGRL